MNQSHRERLTGLLRGHVADIAADLRAQMLKDGPVRARAQKLHADEQVGEDFAVWTDLLSRRAAVLWVLKSVYVRVLEDKGLLSPGRLLDPEAWQLFERLAPNLGETAFLRWVYRDLASERGGLPELFGPQPAEVAVPADELSRKLIASWRARDPDTGHHWSFADERFDGELMGDLYQELDPTVKDRFALCQTPDFVREFILDRTLTPAIEEFGADTVRLLDPACGSGHFLIDGLKRLVEATAAVHPDWERRRLVRHALDRVVGIDLNDYACALARARLIMTAADLAGVSTLSEAAAFHPHVYWADGLEQVERGKDTRGQQLDLLDASKNEAPKASLSRPEVRAELRKVLAPKFHVVAANPPYDPEKDPVRKAYHREKIGRSSRYKSAFKEYGLGSLFVERSIQLSTDRGWVGLITANNFMKRDWGRPHVEQVLSQEDLFMVVDTSGAILAPSGFETPTVMLFLRHQPPTDDNVHVVTGLRADTSRPEDRSQGTVWRSIVQHWKNVGHTGEHTATLLLPRVVLAHHPWTLGRQTARELMAILDTPSRPRLSDVVGDVGFACMTRADELYVQDHSVMRRHGLVGRTTIPAVEGTVVRDWMAVPRQVCVFPYDDSGQPVPEAAAPRLHAFLWPFRSMLWRRQESGAANMRELGMQWWEWSRIHRGRFSAPTVICYSAIATHNHFALAPGGRAFRQSSPVVVPLADAPAGYSPHAVLAVLNCSATAFWCRQVLQRVGGRSSGTKRQSEPWAQRMDFAVRRVETIPIVEDSTGVLAALGAQMVDLSAELGSTCPENVLSDDWSADDFNARLDRAQERRTQLIEQMVALQEEVDWAVYQLLGLTQSDDVAPVCDPEGIGPGHRPFALLMARAWLRGEVSRYWFDAVNVEPTTNVPMHYGVGTRARVAARLGEIEANDRIALMETPECKRKWEIPTWENLLIAAATEWIARTMEQAVESRQKPATLEHITTAVEGDPRLLSVARSVSRGSHVDVRHLVLDIVSNEAVPNHPFHTYTADGLVVREAWEQVWELQRREDRGEHVGPIEPPPEYSQGSRGKPTHFLRNEYWKLRGKLDVPKERFIAFTEVPGRAGDETLYGWAGWTPIQRIRVMLGIDEDLDDDGVPLADRTGLLDSAWRLLPDAEREDAATASRLRAELRATIGGDGFSKEQLADWKARFPPPSSSRRGRPAPVAHDESDDNDDEVDDE